MTWEFLTAASRRCMTNSCDSTAEPTGIRDEGMLEFAL